MRAWAAAQIPPQHGRIAVVTGANSGLGFETARELARRGARVMMGCRDAAKGEAARARIAAEIPSADVAVEPLDLADLASVADFARRQLARDARLDLLINNAGIMGVPQGRTREGFELQFGTNHLGHFALTAQLHGAIARTPESRVVTVTSLGYRIGRIDFDELEMPRRYDRWLAYGRSKLANLVFACEYQRRLEEAKSTAISVAAHPGYAATNLQQIQASTLAQHAYNAIVAVSNRTFAMSADAGALSQLYAATAPDVAPGGFYGPRWFGMRGGPAPQRSTPLARDRALAERLWRRSEELVGVAFEV